MKRTDSIITRRKALLVIGGLSLSAGLGVGNAFAHQVSGNRDGHMNMHDGRGHHHGQNHHHGFADDDGHHGHVHAHGDSTGRVGRNFAGRHHGGLTHHHVGQGKR